MSKPARRTLEGDETTTGRRLCLGSIAADFNISLRQMAQACRLSAAAVCDIVTRNEWPVRTPKQQIQDDLRALFKHAGASEEQLAALFKLRVTCGVSPRYAPLQKAVPTKGVSDVLLQKQVLTPAARKAFKLFVNPFDGEVMEDSQMFTSSEIAYCRECCIQAALGARFVALIGESGSGKTTLQADVEAHLSKGNRQVLVIKPSVLGMEQADGRGKALKSADILAAIIATLDGHRVIPQTIEARSQLVRRLMMQSIESGFLHLLLIEEAHSMPDATLKHLKRLHELRHGRRPMLGILLLAQPELAAKLEPHRVALREVAQRCEIVKLPALGADLVPYLEHRARGAGRSLAEFIDQSGIDELRCRLSLTRTGRSGAREEVSLLYPLAVNNLLTGALNLAASLGVPIVTADVVKAV